MIETREGEAAWIIGRQLAEWCEFVWRAKLAEKERQTESLAFIDTVKEQLFHWKATSGELAWQLS